MSSADSKAATAADNIVIAARSLTKKYGTVSVVDAINFDIARGEVFGLLGPNGAGKTTTILMMLGLTEISSGTVGVLGHDPARSPLQVKRRVGYLPDSVGFYDHLTAGENLAYTAKLMGLPPAERARRIVAAIPDLHANVQDIFGHGDEVVVRLVVTGTQEGPLLGIPATGRHLQWDAIDLYRLKGGKISQEWASEDLTAILNDTGTYKAPWIP